MPLRIGWLLTLASLAVSAWAQRASLRRVTTREYPGATIRGGLLMPHDPKQPLRLLTWGDRVRLHSLPKGKVSEVGGYEGFGAAGCLVDANQDGQQDLVLLERAANPGSLGRMIWLEAPDWKLHLIDSDADFSECIGTSMYGRAGVLLIHRQAQVRFYEIPKEPSQKWPYHEIYSIYTPSAQGGLLRGDVDGDGHPDIFAGNYWLKAPDVADHPWRLFAINQWWDKPRSAMLRLAVAKPLDTPFPILFAAEAEASPARMAWFERPADPRQLWLETKLEALPPLRKPEAIAAGDLNGDMRPDLVVGENNGPGSRLLIYWSVGPGKYQGTRVDITAGINGLWLYDYDSDGNLDIIGSGPHQLYVWRSQRRK